MKKRQEIKINYNLFFLIFFYMQPFLDVIYAISANYLNFEFSLNSIIRFVFLGIAVIYLLFFNKNKKTKLLTCSLLIYCLAFVINVFITKKPMLFYEVRNMLSTFYFPFILMFMYEFYKQKNISIDNKHFLFLEVIYLGFIIIPNLLGLGFNTYPYSKSGLSGWFYSGNSVSSILTILFPITLLFFDSKKKIPILCIYFLLLIYTFLTIGTKTPLVGLLLITTLFVLVILFKLIKAKKYKLITILLTSFFIGIFAIVLIIPKTSFYKNIKLHMKYFEIYDLESALEDNKLIKQIIFSNRFSFLEETKNNYNRSNVSTKLIGLGYVEKYNTKEENQKFIEIDYFDIFYRHGIIGSLLYFASLIFVLLKIFEHVFSTNLTVFSYSICLFIILLLALFCGHIFITPSVSIIESYILVNRKKEFI